MQASPGAPAVSVNCFYAQHPERTNAPLTPARRISAGYMRPDGGARPTAADGTGVPFRYGTGPVLDILAAGINVITTVNIQHLESIAEQVEHMTGVPVRERVPDWVVRKANRTELVDSSPEQLRRRMSSLAPRAEGGVGNRRADLGGRHRLGRQRGTRSQGSAHRVAS